MIVQVKFANSDTCIINIYVYLLDGHNLGNWYNRSKMPWPCIVTIVSSDISSSQLILYNTAVSQLLLPFPCSV